MKQKVTFFSPSQEDLFASIQFDTPFEIPQKGECVQIDLHKGRFFFCVSDRMFSLREINGTVVWHVQLIGQFTKIFSEANDD